MCAFASRKILVEDVKEYDMIAGRERMTTKDIVFVVKDGSSAVI
jgi:hypothetical protein